MGMSRIAALNSQVSIQLRFSTSYWAKDPGVLPILTRLRTTSGHVLKEAVQLLIFLHYIIMYIVYKKKITVNMHQITS